MMILPLRDVPELGGRDPIDARLGAVPAVSAGPRRPRWVRSRLALGLAPTPVPGLVLLPLGMALGPHGLGVLSHTTLSYLDPAMSVALTALGVFIGLGLVLRPARERRLIAAASAEALATIVVVAGGLLGARRLVWPDLSGSVWVAVVTIAICASASSTAAGRDRGTGAIAARVGDLDDVLPVILGGLVLATLREGLGWPALLLFGQSIALALVVAIAGALLVSDVAGDAEQRVFALGALLLLAGVAEYLALSALLVGFVAGLFWNLAAPRVRDRIARDVRHVQHPLVVLLLLVAGASVEASIPLAILTVSYMLFRLIGKLAGGWLAARVAGLKAPATLGVYLLSPGVIGIAFALNALAAGDAESGARVLSAVVFGSMAFELLSLVVHPPEEDA